MSYLAVWFMAFLKKKYDEGMMKYSTSPELASSSINL